MARALEDAGADLLACADIEEGAALRAAGVRADILVFGALSVSDLDGLFDCRLTPTISTPGAARAVQAAAARYKQRLRYHLKIDTGMNRLGFRFDNLRRTLPELLASENLELDAVYTHFATADDPGSALFDQQRVRFDRALDEIDELRGERDGRQARPFYRHAANSAALLRDSRVWFDRVRPGLLLYGIVPPPLASTIPLEPVMTLDSRVVAVKGMRPGEITGYGARFTAERPTSVAIVPAGYADGLDLRLAGRGSVLIRGRRAPIVGSVCMDMLMADVTGLDVSPGDEVVIIGSQGDDRIDVREMAATIGTIPWEIVCRVGSRIERIYECDRDRRAGTRDSRVPSPDRRLHSMAKPPRPSSSVRSAARSRRSGSAAVADCGAWNSLVEERAVRRGGAPPAAHRYALGGRRRRRRGCTPRSRSSSTPGCRPASTSSIACWAAASCPARWCCSAASRASASRRCCCRRPRTWRAPIGPVLYSSGEESEHQIKSRGERLGVGDAPLYLLAETCLERILEEIARIKPSLVIVDSIQTVFSLKFQSAPGSIGQVREAATQLLFTAKGQNVPTLLVGHVTKDGSLAGPKALEHVVDTVLYFEGERHHSHRVVRAVKNRFGAVSELGVFEMTVGRSPAGAEPVEAVSRRASAERARVRRSCARSRARGRSWSKCRRSSAAAPMEPPAAWPAASISSGCRCCSRSSRSAPA